MLLSAVLMAYRLLTNASYKTILDRLTQGIATTLTVTLTAYPFAIIIGLLPGWGEFLKTRSSTRWRPCMCKSFAAFPSLFN